MKKILAVLFTVAAVALPMELVEARGGGRSGRSGARSGTRGRGKAKSRDAKEVQARNERENRDGLLRDAARDAI